MNQEFAISGKRIWIMIAVLFTAISIVLRRRKYEYFYDGIIEYEKRYVDTVPFVLLVVGLFQYYRQNAMGFSHMLQYVHDKLSASVMISRGSYVRLKVLGMLRCGSFVIMTSLIY